MLRSRLVCIVVKDTCTSETWTLNYLISTHEKFKSMAECFEHECYFTRRAWLNWLRISNNKGHCPLRYGLPLIIFKNADIGPLFSNWPGGLHLVYSASRHRRRAAHCMYHFPTRFGYSGLYGSMHLEDTWSAKPQCQQTCAILSKRRTSNYVLGWYYEEYPMGRCFSLIALVPLVVPMGKE